MSKLTDNLIFEIADQTYQQLQEELEKLPYSANAIEELHANENAHSRILRMLLQYSAGRTWPVYHSFLKLIKSKCSYFKYACSSPSFANEKDRIDLLIKDKFQQEKWAVIVENKVCEAGDRDTQIERYINKVKYADISSKNIFVVYLTSDGIKQISINSLTDEAKKALDYLGELDKGRFVEMNYCDDILPWLENDVLPIIPHQEELLLSSIKLYIDFLKGMFGFRNEEQIYANIRKKIMTNFGINSIQDGFEVQEKLNSLQSELNEIIRQKANELLLEHVRKPLTTFIQEHNGSIVYLEYYADNRFSCFVEIKKWDKLRIQITHEEGIGIFGLCHKDLNNNPLDAGSVSELRKMFDGYKSSQWWPAYKRLDCLDNSAGTPELWDSICKGVFCDKFEKWIGDVLQKTDGLSL